MTVCLHQFEMLIFLLLAEASAWFVRVAGLAVVSELASPRACE